MSETKFTPGPWFAVQHPGGWSIQTSKIGGGECVAMQYAFSSLANARLIASAPMLYEALEDARILVVECCLSSAADLASGDLLKTIDEALAAARGEPA